MSDFISRLENNLIPTHRVDKNGNVVIRHMKDGVAGGAARTTIFPAPKAKLPAEAVSLVSEAADVIIGCLPYRSGTSKRLPGVKRALRKFSPATLRRIISAQSLKEQQVLVYIRNELSEREPREAYVNDLLHLSGKMTENGMYLDFSTNYILGLQKYEGLTPVATDGSYPTERYSQSIALLRVTDKIWRMVSSDQADESALDYVPDDFMRYSEPRIADKELVSFILTSSESDRERIVTLVEDRSVINADDIKILLEDGSTSSLSSGVL
jgi:hypothetical protein